MKYKPMDNQRTFGGHADGLLTAEQTRLLNSRCPQIVNDSPTPYIPLPNSDIHGTWNFNNSLSNPVESQTFTTLNPPTITNIAPSSVVLDPFDIPLNTNVIIPTPSEAILSTVPVLDYQSMPYNGSSFPNIHNNIQSPQELQINQGFDIASTVQKINPNFIPINCITTPNLAYDLSSCNIDSGNNSSFTSNIQQSLVESPLGLDNNLNQNINIATDTTKVVHKDCAILNTPPKMLFTNTSYQSSTINNINNDNFNSTRLLQGQLTQYPDNKYEPFDGYSNVPNSACYIDSSLPIFSSVATYPNSRLVSLGTSVNRGSFLNPNIAKTYGINSGNINQPTSRNKSNKLEYNSSGVSMKNAIMIEPLVKSEKKRLVTIHKDVLNTVNIEPMKRIFRGKPENDCNLCIKKKRINDSMNKDSENNIPINPGVDLINMEYTENNIQRNTSINEPSNSNYLARELQSSEEHVTSLDDIQKYPKIYFESVFKSNERLCSSSSSSDRDTFHDNDTIIISSDAPSSDSTLTIASQKHSLKVNNNPIINKNIEQVSGNKIIYNKWNNYKPIYTRRLISEYTLNWLKSIPSVPEITKDMINYYTEE